MKDFTVDRRVFCQLLASAAGAFAVQACQGESDERLADTETAGADSAPPPSDTAQAIDWEATPDLPSLGGAPDTHEGRVVAAFVDTVVPGKHRDPTGVVGGLDVGAPGAIFDERLPSAALIPVLVAFLDSVSTSEFERSFDALIPAEREEALASSLELLPQMGFAVQMAKLATYAAPETHAALGYPGPNAGYLDDPTWTFGSALAAPHPATVGGNFP